ncbi:hypothetical protein [Brevibacillus laterosporus]|uniref:hypothetical protein n=1 Tax=Brevibacillus laterosporus TaxID=1465 RepID=UPI001EF387F4|nr:hypothetical protein [Brevibacillus laterosporus]MCG7318023.1 hypothetical protein [Brevibacillus laterosporus]
MELHDILTNIQYFQPYIKKSTVMKQLESMGIFSSFKDIYSQVREETEDEHDAWYNTCSALVKGIELGEFSQEDLDELLFRLIEDSLFNSYLYTITSHNISLSDPNALPAILNSWKAPLENVILRNVIQQETSDDFIICGYRSYPDSNDNLAAIRLLLLDSQLVKIHKKNEEEYHVAYPTIVELDFERGLLHIRQKGVENIESDFDEISTIKGRIENTLTFVTSLRPSISVEKIIDFRKALFQIEENLLSEKRDKAQELLESFNGEIDKFTEIVVNTFHPSADDGLDPREYISFAVLSIISTTINSNDLGDIVGIKFRNTKDESSQKYAEIYITDKGFKCISSNELYWLNLPILLDQKAVESLKIGKMFQSGFVIFTLGYSLDTANLRILQRSTHPDESLDRQPSDEKYYDVVNFINQFL